MIAGRAYLPGDSRVDSDVSRIPEWANHIADGPIDGHRHVAR